MKKLLLPRKYCFPRMQCHLNIYKRLQSIYKYLQCHVTIYKWPFLETSLVTVKAFLKLIQPLGCYRMLCPGLQGQSHTKTSPGVSLLVPVVNKKGISKVIILWLFTALKQSSSFPYHSSWTKLKFISNFSIPPSIAYGDRSGEAQTETSLLPGGSHSSCKQLEILAGKKARYRQVWRYSW